MNTGLSGTYVIAWRQVSLHGTLNAPIADLCVGAELCLRGSAMRLDGPPSVAVLQQSTEQAVLHARAARKARRVTNPTHLVPPRPKADLTVLDDTILLTDGHDQFACVLLDRPEPLLAFQDRLPPSDTVLWVTQVNRRPAPAQARPGGVICFAAGTTIATPTGPRAVETLAPGELVHTRDNGAQPVLWRGARLISGARLYAMPHLRPLRIRSGALGIDRPCDDLLVSPDHRVLVTGPAARALFNEPEVLVRACDLLDLPLISVDLTLEQVTYVHLAFARHEIVQANGLPCESFDPACADFSALTPADRDSLLLTFPDLAIDPTHCPPPARRVLQMSEAALLCHRLN